MINNSPWIGPSILTADFLRLGDEIASAERAGVDYIHLDVMDGRFVPNISFGFPVIEAVRRATELPLDLHLMIDEPDKYIEDFISAGATTVTFQIEATVHSHRTLARIRELEVNAGLALCPGTSLSTVEELIPFIDTLLIMTVNPGFGGQSFIPAMSSKINRAREMIEARNPQCRLQVDGGVKPCNIRRVVEWGADTLVAGSSIFDGTGNIQSNVGLLRSALDDR